MTLRLRYLTLKLRALCWVLRRSRARRPGAPLSVQAQTGLERAVIALKDEEIETGKAKERLGLSKGQGVKGPQLSGDLKGEAAKLAADAWQVNHAYVSDAKWISPPKLAFSCARWSSAAAKEENPTTLD